MRRRGFHIFRTVRSQMAVRSSALGAGLPLPLGRFLVLIYVTGWVDPRGHSVAGRIKSVEKFDDLIGNQIRDLVACNIVPQPTTLPRASCSDLYPFKNTHFTLASSFATLPKPTLDTWSPCPIHTDRASVPSVTRDDTLMGDRPGTSFVAGFVARLHNYPAPVSVMARMMHLPSLPPTVSWIGIKLSIHNEQL
jgi:hypothetical protein